MKNPQDAQNDELIRQLFHTTRIFSRTLNSVVSHCGLHSTEWMVFYVIYSRGGMSQAELNRYFKVEPAAITRTLTRLEKKGYVFRRPMDKGRGKYVEVTADGGQLYDTLKAAVIAHRNQALQGLTAADKMYMFRVLAKIQHNLKTE